MNIRYQIITVLIVVIILFSLSVPGEASGVKLVINGERVQADLVPVNRTTLIPAWIVSEYLGQQLTWNQMRRELQIRGRNQKSKLQLGQKTAYVNSQPISLKVEPKIINDQIMMPIGFLHKAFGGRIDWEGSTNTIYYSQVVTSSLSSGLQKTVVKKKRIVIDPGHGGRDPGAVGLSGTQEKNLNYQIAQKAAGLLRNEGYEVMLTRTGDRYVSLSHRAQMANSWSADLFVSIHANSNNRAWYRGTSTYAHPGASKDNWALAWYIQDEILSRIELSNNGLKADDFAVLRETRMPAVLIETAFISNYWEEHLLSSSRFQQRIAEGIVAGVKRYFVK